MNIVSLKLPVSIIASAIRLVKDAGTKYIKIEDSVHKLGTEEEARKYAGEDGVQKRAAEIEKADAAKKAVVEETQAELDKLHEKAVSFIEDQTTPNGNDVIGDNAGDFALVEHGLIETPEKLERILEKHDNVAFRYAAQKYAAVRGWEGFSFLENEKAFHEYLEQVFNRLKAAVGNPYGMHYMQYVETPNEYQRIAAAYGIAKAFSESGGDKLIDVIKE